MKLTPGQCTVVSAPLIEESLESGKYEIIKDEQGLYTVLPKKTNQSSQTNSVTLRPIPRDIPTGEDISPASLSIETEHDHYPLSTTEVKITITNHSHYEYECEFRYDQRVTRSRKEKRRKYFYFLRFSTQTRGRTGMEVNPLVFETSASTDSAIWAHT